MSFKIFFRFVSRLGIAMIFSGQVQAWTLDECVEKTSALNNIEKSRAVAGGFSNLPDAFLWGCDTGASEPSVVYMMRLMFKDKNELEFTKAKMRFDRAKLERGFLAEPPKELTQNFCPLYKSGKLSPDSSLIYRILSFDPLTKKDEELIKFRAASQALCK